MTRQGRAGLLSSWLLLSGREAAESLRSLKQRGPVHTQGCAHPLTGHLLRAWTILGRRGPRRRDVSLHSGAHTQRSRSRALRPGLRPGLPPTLPRDPEAGNCGLEQLDTQPEAGAP